MRDLVSLLSKINVLVVARDHIRTLKIETGNGRERFSRSDLTIFYILSLAFAGLVAGLGPVLDKSALSLTISVFSIFAALLFSAQVAMYGIFRASYRKGTDHIDQLLQDAAKQDEKALLVEVNSNISYLILIALISVSVSFFGHVFSLEGSLLSFAVVCSTSHFLLTLLMLIGLPH